MYYFSKFCSKMFQHNDNHRQNFLSSSSSQNYGRYHKYHTHKCKSLPQAMHHIMNNKDKTVVLSTTQTLVTDL